MRTNKEWFELGIDRFIQKMLMVSKGIDTPALERSCQMMKDLTMIEFPLIERLEHKDEGENDEV
jgi:hypothetical protein